MRREALCNDTIGDLESQIRRTMGLIKPLLFCDSDRSQALRQIGFISSRVCELLEAKARINVALPHSNSTKELKEKLQPSSEWRRSVQTGNPNDYRKAIAKKFGELRKSTGLSQREFAKNAQIAEGFVIGMESGFTPFFLGSGVSARAVESLIKAAQFLNFDPLDFFILS